MNDHRMPADEPLSEIVEASRATNAKAGSARRPLAWTAFAVSAAAILAMAAGVSRAGTGATPAQAADGKSLYEANCVACHGDDGAGTPTGQALMAPDLRSDMVQKATDADLKKQVSGGKNNMPPFKDSLKPEEISAVVAYVRTLAHKK